MHRNLVQMKVFRDLQYWPPPYWI